MGDPRRFKNKYSRPAHPWQLARIEEEHVVVREYGFRAKRELWKVESKLKSFASQAKRLTALRTTQAKLETKQLLDRLNRLGLLPVSATLDDVLGLTLKNLLDRRLQTLVFKKGLARTPLQARQFIVHEHVLVGKKQVCSPNYLVPVADEAQISIIATSTLANPEHPERAFKPKPVASLAKESVKDVRGDRKGDRRDKKFMRRPKFEKKAPEKKPEGEKK